MSQSDCKFVNAIFILDDNDPFLISVANNFVGMSLKKFIIELLRYIGSEPNRSAFLGSKVQR